MDKVNLLNTLLQLQAELVARLAEEEQASRDAEKIADHKAQLIRIQAELDRIILGRADKPQPKLN
jgi:hypothetical protein